MKQKTIFETIYEQRNALVSLVKTNKDNTYTLKLSTGIKTITLPITIQQFTILYQGELWIINNKETTPEFTTFTLLN